MIFCATQIYLLTSLHRRRTAAKHCRVSLRRVGALDKTDGSGPTILAVPDAKVYSGQCSSDVSKASTLKAKATTERKTLIFNHIPSGFFIMLTQPKIAKSQTTQYQLSQSLNKFSLLLFRITLEKHQAFHQRVRHPCSVWADKEAAVGEHAFHRCRACPYTQYTLTHRLETFELTPLGQCGKRSIFQVEGKGIYSVSLLQKTPFLLLLLIV